jgi:hypothetical protein
MKNGWEGFNTVAQLITPILSSGIMTREDREECWASNISSQFPKTRTNTMLKNICDA